MSGVAVKLSQEALFFPLPFTNATIENVVQITNLLKADSAKPKANVISFKVLSAIRHRYSVRPAIGFIAPGEAITINFALDPESIRNNPDPEARVLPTEKTKDVIYIDFAIVCGEDGGDEAGESAYGKYLAAWLAAKGAGRGVNEKKPVMDEAGKFWKARGAVKGAGDSGSLRRKLACMFTPRDAVPENLVVCMKAEGDNGGSNSHARGSVASAAAPPPPTSRPPTTSSTRRDSTMPPDMPPRRCSVNSPSASTTPRASRGGTRQQQQSPERVTAAPNARATPSASPPTTAATTGRQTLATASADRKRQFSLQQAAMAFRGEEAERRKALWKTVMNYKVPYAAAALCIVLALLCGMFESHTFLSWLIAGK